MADPTFFATPAELRAWFEAHAETESNLLVGFHRKGSGRPSITWPESVDQALCFGWIDGIRRGIDEHSYTIRFTPRKPRSNWSAVNIRRAQELIDTGLMRPAGLRAFARRTDDRSAIYSYEQRHEAKLDAEQERQFRTNRKAWQFFQAQPPGYQRIAIYWIASAKRAETRARRLATLIEDSAEGRQIAQLARPPRSR